MSLFTRLRGATPQRTNAQCRPRSRCRLHLERLEDRSVPATYSAATVPELIAAIDAANLTAEADTITLAAGTNLTLTEVNNTTNGATGLPTIAANEDLTIIGNGGIIERSAATGSPGFRLFDVAAGASLRLENLTLQGGLAFGSGVSAQGGAIFNQGVLTLSGVTLRNNSVHADVSGNAYGGGIYSSGSLVVESTTIQDNRASGGAGYSSDAGGSSGGSASGGGVYIASGTASLTSVTIAGNRARGGDGGVSYGGGGGDGRNDRSRKGSAAWAYPGGGGFGGGLYVASGTVTLSSATFTGNLGQGGNAGVVEGGTGAGGSGLGGGVFVAAGSTVTGRSTTVTDNTAQGGQGSSGVGQGAGGGLYIQSSALVCLDDFTIQHVVGNKASAKKYANIFGSFTICP